MKATYTASRPRISHILFVVLILTGTTASAQIGKVGLNTSSPQALLHVADSSVLFSYLGPVPSAFPPPASGAGKRFMWYPAKGALRVGGVDGTQWDQGSIGNYSFASGFNTIASNAYSTAIGLNSHATGDNATAIGKMNEATMGSTVAIGEECFSTAFGAIAIGLFNTSSGYNAITLGGANVASGDNSIAIGNTLNSEGYSATTIGSELFARGDYSTSIGYLSEANGTFSSAIGFWNIADGEYSFASGQQSTAVGNNTHALGKGLFADAYGSVVVGSYNDNLQPYSAESWVSTQQLFVIGNGEDDGSRSNAVTVLKNGNVGIGEITPTEKVEINGSVRLGTNGTGIQEIIKQTFTRDIPDIAATGTVLETFSIVNAAPGSTVYISPADDLDDGVVIASARVSTADTVEVKFTNITSVSIDPVNMDFHITVIR